jgi:glutamine synthetase
LVLAAVLAGIWHGIEGKLTPPPAIEGNAWDQDIKATPLPTTMDQAIDAFDGAQTLSEYLTTEFKTLFLATKQQEWSEFARHVTEFELETYLRM